MIRYNITYNDLRELVRKEDADWLRDAEEKTETFRRLGKYSEIKNIWRRVKKVFMRLQHNKCAFCERKLEAPESGGAREFDKEHFRPKSSVKSWPSKKMIREFGLPDDFPRSEGSSRGYYLLPYHLFNYSVACKPCNSSFKGSYFPIGGNRNVDSDNPLELGDEAAYLIYPIGDIDADPEQVITFDGVSAVPAVRDHNDPAFERARVTILLFNLNGREELLRARAEKISFLFHALKSFHSQPTPEDKELAERWIAHLTAAESSHTNCLRSFKRLYDRDENRAREVAMGIMKYLSSGS